jgi:hypothetical protein
MSRDHEALLKKLDEKIEESRNLRERLGILKSRAEVMESQVESVLSRPLPVAEPPPAPTPEPEAPLLLPGLDPVSV